MSRRISRQDVINNWPSIQNIFERAGVTINLDQGLYVYDSLAGNAPHSIDEIDLSTVSFARSPNVQDWPITTILSMQNDGGNITFSLSPEPSDSWKWYTGHLDDNFQYTIWAIHDNVACGFIQQWQGREKKFESPLTNWRNWWGVPDGSATAGVFDNYIPKSGDKIGFMVTAGNARSQRDVTSVAERSNTILFTL